MKLNIKRLQEGGGMPFVTYRPAPSMTTPDTSSAETTSSKSSKKSDSESDSPSLLSKGVIDELIKKGLPNDVNKFLSDLQSAEKSSLMGMESGVGGIDRNKLYSLASKANQLIHNSNLMESATKQAYDNDGLEELAVSATGQLFVQDKQGKIAQISMGEYTKKKDSVYALTVNDLSKARMYNPNLAFDTEIIATIQNSMGINKINDYMLGIINKLGTETLNKEGYIDKQKLKETIVGMQGKNPTESELKGIQELASTYQNMGKDGIYKVTTENSSQRNHISDGFEYLWALLPNNARNVLKARYVVDGNESANPVNIIRNAFIKHTNESNSSKLDYPAGMNKEEGSGDGSDKKVFQEPLEKLINGSLDIINDFTLSNPDVSKVGLNLKGSTMNQLPTVKGNMLSSTTLDNVLASGLGAASTKKGIYFGDKLVEDYNFQNVIYDGGQVINTMVPVDVNGKPNLELLENYSNALNEMSEKNITNPMQKNQILESYGLSMIKYDANGKLSPISKSYLKPFVVMHGYTTDESKLVDNNKFSIKYKGDEGENYEKLIENLYTSLKLTPPNFGWTSGNSVHKAPIFIPLSPSAQTDVSHFTGHGSLVTANTLQQNLIRQDNSNNSVYAGADLLNYE